LFEFIDVAFQVHSDNNSMNNMNRIIRNVVKFSTLNVTNEFRPTLETFASALGIFNNLAEYYPDEYKGIDKGYIRYVVANLSNQGTIYAELINKANSLYMNAYGRSESLI
jgi:hypothetical protein